MECREVLGRARSLLFVPGDRPDRFAKAAAAADLAVLDLEDGVGPDGKDAARDAVSAALGDLAAVVRINSTTSPWHEDDLRALAARPPSAVMVPKAETGEQLHRVARALPGVPLLPLVETATGLLAAAALAQVPQVARLAFGNLDLLADLGCLVDPLEEEENLLHARSTLVVASAAAGLPSPLDGVCPDLEDVDLLARSAARAAGLGMGGKLCVHPRQASVVERAFSPSPAQVAWAQRILGHVGDGAVRVGGAMVDEPVLIRARRILHTHQWIEPEGSHV